MTAVEVDGIRLSNNASFSGANGIDTKNIATTNIESVEIITGIPSVEYGDVSGGVVNIKTKKGSTPLEAFVSVSPKTRTYALSKGFNLGANNGLINLSLERTESTSGPASPYTKYDRNGGKILYSNTLGKGTSSPLAITAKLTGNSGG